METHEKVLVLLELFFAWGFACIALVGDGYWWARGGVLLGAMMFLMMAAEDARDAAREARRRRQERQR